MSVNPIVNTGLEVLASVNNAPKGNLGVDATKSGAGVANIGENKGLSALSGRSNQLVEKQTQNDTVKAQQKFNRTALSLFKASNTLDSKNPGSPFNVSFSSAPKDTASPLPGTKTPDTNAAGLKKPDITPPPVQNELIKTTNNLAKNHNQVLKNANQNPTDFAGRANRAMQNIVFSNNAVKEKGPDITPPTIENNLNKNVNKFAQAQNMTLEKMAGNATDVSLRQDQTIRNVVFTNNALKDKGPDITPPTIENNLNKNVNKFAQAQNMTMADKDSTSVAGIANRTMQNVVFSNNAVKKQGPDITPPPVQNNLNSKVNQFAQTFNTSLKEATANPTNFAGRANQPMSNIVVSSSEAQKPAVQASPDTGPAQLVKAVNDFATSFNKTLKNIQDNPVDIAGRENRPLKNIVMEKSDAFSSIGVEVKPTGMLDVNQPKLTQAAEQNPNSISDIFSGTGGMASKVSNEAAAFINSSISPLTSFNFSEVHNGDAEYGPNSGNTTGVFFSSPA